MLLRLRLAFLCAIRFATTFLFLGAAVFAGTLTPVLSAIFAPCAITIFVTAAAAALAIGAPVTALVNRRYLKRFNPVGALRLTFRRLRRRRQNGEGQY